MSASLIVERGALPGGRVGRTPANESRVQFVESAVAPTATQHDCTEARTYGASFVTILGHSSLNWEAIEPLARAGWASRHDQFCAPRHDWRLSWPAVRAGWREAGGPFDPPPPITTTHTPAAEPIIPTPGTHVFDAFGEAAGRVNVVRQADFLLARPAGYAACAWALLFAVANVYWGLGAAWQVPSPTQTPRAATPRWWRSTGWPCR
jgi:hypothetical protein